MLTRSVDQTRWNLEEGTRIVTLGISAAMLGISLFSARGLIVGAILGMITGHLRNKELRRERLGRKDH